MVVPWADSMGDIANRTNPNLATNTKAFFRMLFITLSFSGTVRDNHDGPRTANSRPKLSEPLPLPGRKHPRDGFGNPFRVRHPRASRPLHQRFVPVPNVADV